MSIHRIVSNARQPLTLQVIGLTERYNQFLLEGRPVVELKRLLQDARAAIRRIDSRVFVDTQRALAMTAIDAVEKEIVRINDGGRQLLIDELMAGRVYHPDIVANKQTVVDHTVRSIRLGEKCGDGDLLFTDEWLREHYTERVGNCTRVDALLGLDLSIDASTTDDESGLALLRVRVRDRHGSQLIPVDYCYRAVNGTTTAVGVIRISLAVYEKQSRRLGGTGFAELGNGVPLFLEVACSDRTQVAGFDDSALHANILRYKAKAAKSVVANQKAEFAGRR